MVIGRRREPIGKDNAGCHERALLVNSRHLRVAAIRRFNLFRDEQGGETKMKSRLVMLTVIRSSARTVSARHARWCGMEGQFRVSERGKEK